MEIVKKYEKIFQIFTTGEIVSEFYNSKIGILSILEMGKYIVENLSIINYHIIDYSFFKKEIKKISPELSNNDELINDLYKEEIKRFLALMESVFLNGIIVYFLKYGNIGIKNFQNIEEDYILSAVNRNNLFKFAIVDNAFLRNLRLVQELDSGRVKGLKNFIFSYIDIQDGNIKNLYIFNDETVRMFQGLLGKQKYTTKEQAIENKTEEILDNINIYSKLFKKFISADFNYEKIIDATKKSNKNKIYAKVADAINTLGINKSEDNIEKNLKEMMVYLVAYQGEKVKEYLEYKEDK